MKKIVIAIAILSLIFIYWPQSKEPSTQLTIEETTSKAKESVTKENENPFLWAGSDIDLAKLPYQAEISESTASPNQPLIFADPGESEPIGLGAQSQREEELGDVPPTSNPTGDELERAIDFLFDDIREDQDSEPNQEDVPSVQNSQRQSPIVDQTDDIGFDRPDSLIGGGISSPQSNDLMQELANELPPAEEQEEEAEEEDSPEWYQGQARGYTLLSLMQPESRQSVEVQIAIMLQSRLEQLYLGVLTDGTFSWDPQYLASVIRRLNRDGRQLTLALYLTNGATMRAYAETPIDAGFNTTAPEDFRDLIRFNSDTREEFVLLAQRVKPLFELNKSLNSENRNVAIMMLEDNLTRESYSAIRSLAGEVFGDLVEYARNPCIECYDGNDADSLGDFLEFHRPEELAMLGVGEGYSLDGTGFSFPFEEGVRGISVEQVQSLLSQSLVQELDYFGLWRFDRQGLHLGDNTDPSDREYVVPTARHIDGEIELLRFGLSKNTED